MLVCWSKQICVRPGVGKREDEFAVCGVEVEKHPDVLDVAIMKPPKVAGKRMILILGFERLTVGQFEDDIVQEGCRVFVCHEDQTGTAPYNDHYIRNLTEGISWRSAV